MTVSATPVRPRGSSHRQRSDRLAGRLARAGALLGVLAGTLELTVGPLMREWVGGKQTPPGSDWSPSR